MKKRGHSRRLLSVLLALVMLLSLIGDTAVCQVVDPLATVRFTLRRPVFALEF